MSLRSHCKVHGTDPRCDISNVDHKAVDEMAKDVCESLPKTHQAVESGGAFDLKPSANPKHDDEIAKLITSVCDKWVLGKNNQANMARLIFANLDAGKSTQVILHPLQERFCAAACANVGVENEPLGDEPADEL